MMFDSEVNHIVWSWEFNTFVALIYRCPLQKNDEKCFFGAHLYNITLNPYSAF